MNKKYYEILKINTYINNHKNEFNKEIGIMIKEWRTKRNISLEEMSMMTLMSPSYINQLERGVNGISLNKFIIICNALKINLKEVLDEYMFTDIGNEDYLYKELQEGKNISENVIEFMKNRK